MTENELIKFFNHLGDEPADALLRPTSAAGTELARALRERGRNDEEIPNAPDLMENWTNLPPWADPTGIRAAQEFFYRSGARILPIILCAVLPRGYALGGRSAGASRGKAEAARCLRDNVQFLIDVLTPESWTHRGRGIRSLQRLRLLHALARINPGDEFPAARSQADLAAHLAAYCVLPIESLEKLGTPVSSMEAAAYTHFWNVVGHLLGLHPRLRFKSPEAAAAYLRAYEEHAPSSTDTSSTEESPRALLDYMNALLPEGMTSLPEAFLILLMGETRAAELGVSPRSPGLSPPLLDAGTWLHRMGAGGNQTGLILERTGRALLDGLRLSSADEKPPTRAEAFALPPILAGGWKVNSTRRLKRRLRRFTKAAASKS